MPKLSIPAPATPVGAATLAAAGSQVVLYLGNLWWPAFANVPPAVQLAIAVLLTAVLAYLGGWLKVVMSPGQVFSTQLTASPLPTLESSPPGTVSG